MANFRISADETCIELEVVLGSRQTTIIIELHQNGTGIYSWDGSYTFVGGLAIIELNENLTNIKFPVRIVGISGQELQNLSSFIRTSTPHQKTHTFYQMVSESGSATFPPT
jgi:hypothetical protein